MRNRSVLRTWARAAFMADSLLANAQAYEAMQGGGRGARGSGAFPGAAAGGGYAVGTNQYAVSASGYPGGGYPGGGYPGAQHGLMAQASAVSGSCSLLSTHARN